MKTTSLSTQKEIRLLKEIAQQRIKEIKQKQTTTADGCIRDFRTYSKAEAQAWLGIVHPTTFTRLLKSIEQDYPEVKFDQAQNKHYKFTINDLHFLAEVNKTEAFIRGEHDECQVIAVSSLKGGVGKTTDAIHLATGLAITNNKRYRVAVIDLDPQGTGSMFGVPDLSDEDYSVGDLLQGNYELEKGECEKQFIRSCFKQTHIPNLHYLPGRVTDFFFESVAEKMQLAMDNKTQTDIYKILKHTVIDQVSDDFDIIIIDTAPSLNKTFYNAIYAATSVIIPVVPELVAFDATLKYLERFEEIYAIAAQAGHEGYNFIRLLVTNFDNTGTVDTVTVHRTYFQDLKNLYNRRVIPYPIKHSRAIPICADNFMTVFEMKPTDYPKDRKQLMNAVQNISDVVWEVETLCRQSWPSTASVF
jgi:chromosome partitioning protein